MHEKLSTMASFDPEMKPNVMSLTIENGETCKQCVGFEACDESDSSGEFLDCEPSEKCDVNEFTSEGFLIKDAYFEDRDMEHLEFVYEPSFMTSSIVSLDGLKSSDVQCLYCTLPQKSQSEGDIRFDPGNKHDMPIAYVSLSNSAIWGSIGHFQIFLIYFLYYVVEFHSLMYKSIILPFNVLE